MVNTGYMATSRHMNGVAIIVTKGVVTSRHMKDFARRDSRNPANDASDLTCAPLFATMPHCEGCFGLDDVCTTQMGQCR